MEALKKELTAAYDLLESVPVRGGMVEVMAEVRKRLRNAWKLADDAGKEQRGDG